MREERIRQRAAVKKGEIEVDHNSPDYVLDGVKGHGAYDEDIDYKINSGRGRRVKKSTRKMIGS